MTAAADNRLTEILGNWSSASEAERGMVIAVLYNELKGLSVHVLAGEHRRPLQPTALVNEAYLKLIGIERMDFSSKSHFLGLAARVMRQLIVDEARKHSAKKRGQSLQTTLHTDMMGSGFEVIDALAIDAALTELEGIDPAYGKIVEARIFAGMTVSETAALLGVSEPTVKRKWRAARTWLFARLEAEQIKPQAPT